MHQRCFAIRRFDKNTFLLCQLCLVWIAGLSLGYAAARFCGDALNACVTLSVAGTPTFFGALSVNFFPLLISACAVFFYRSLAFALCFFRGVLLGLGFGAVCSAYQGAGLMVTVLLMFSAVVFAPVMLWYFCRRIRSGKLSFGRDTLWCLMLSLVTAIADVWIVSPMLLEIMNF